MTTPLQETYRFHAVCLSICPPMHLSVQQISIMAWSHGTTTAFWKEVWLVSQKDCMLTAI